MGLHLQVESKNHRQSMVPIIVVKPETWKEWCKANRATLFAGALVAASSTIATGLALAQYASSVRK